MMRISWRKNRKKRLRSKESRRRDWRSSCLIVKSTKPWSKDGLTEASFPSTPIQKKLSHKMACTEDTSITIGSGDQGHSSGLMKASTMENSPETTLMALEKSSIKMGASMKDNGHMVILQIPMGGTSMQMGMNSKVTSQMEKRAEKVLQHLLMAQATMVNLTMIRKVGKENSNSLMALSMTGSL
jgi:hypothetical protein